MPNRQRHCAPPAALHQSLDVIDAPGPIELADIVAFTIACATATGHGQRRVVIGGTSTAGAHEDRLCQNTDGAGGWVRTARCGWVFLRRRISRRKYQLEADGDRAGVHADFTIASVDAALDLDLDTAARIAAALSRVPRIRRPLEAKPFVIFPRCGRG